VDKELANRNPKPATDDVIRRIEGEEQAAPTPVDGEALVLGRISARPDALMHKGAGRVRMSFDAGEATAQKIERLRELCRHKFPAARLEDIIDLACEALLDKVAPERRVERREKRVQRKAKAGAAAGLATSERAPALAAPSLAPASAAATPPAMGSAPAPAPSALAPATPSTRRRPAQAVVDAVTVNAGGACEFMSKDGRRCGARAWGQTDHMRPYALGGGGSAENLRHYCAAHNRYAGRQTFGHDARKQSHG
jgi:hypothetical protein